MRPAAVCLLFWVAAAACQGDTPISADLGGSCRTSSDCTTLCLPSPRWPGGMCSRTCMDGAECPADAVCAATPQDGQVCLFSCLDDRDCQFLVSTPASAGWHCGTIDSKLVCMGQ